MGYLKRLHRPVRTLLLVLLGLGFILLAFLPHPTRADNNFTYNIDVNYYVAAAGPTFVNETYNIINNTSGQYLDSIKISAPSANIANLKVYYTDGGSIPFTTETISQGSLGFQYSYTQIKIDFNKANYGAGLKWGFVVEYSVSDLVENKGRANVVYIPGISASSTENYHVSLTVPADYGNVHGFGVEPKQSTNENGTKTYSFNQKDLINNSVQLLFGDSTTYKVNFIYPLENNTGLPKSVDITLPPTTASQTVFIESINPKPKSTRVDVDGNVIVAYSLAPNSKLDVVVDVLADVQFIDYDFSKSGTLSDIPANLVTKYTKATKYWDSDNPEIIKKAKELTAGKNTVAEKIEAINKYVISTLDYNIAKIEYNIRQGALKAYQNPSNVVCLEYSDLMIALLRAAGIPARMPVGYGYSGNLKQSSAVSDSLHSWVDAYVPNLGWVNLDPTWGEKFNNFGISDIDHLAFAIWGESDSAPSAITVNGKDANYQYENVKLEYTSIQPKVSNDAKLSSTKWIILPFLSIVQYSGTTSSNSSAFDLRLQLSEGSKKLTANLGSKAPAQKISGILFDFGLSFAMTAKLDLTATSPAGVLATTQTSNNYLPLIIIIILVSVIIIWRVIKLRNTKRPELEAPKDLTDETKPQQ
ncbi:transglutaminase domain-containing protein [Candidatus Saccharibacteria bacterium]|nr:transglutaminase domain-containing protein [Candidatus Saccharibacteria bacterium]